MGFAGFAPPQGLTATGSLTVGGTLTVATITSPGATALTLQAAGVAAMTFTNDVITVNLNGGTERMRFTDALTFYSISLGASAIAFRSGDPSAADSYLVNDNTAAVIALKNGTTAQEFRVYGTTTGPKYISVKHDGTNGIVDVSASSGDLKLGGNATDIQWMTAAIANGAGSTPVLGSIAGSGPGTALQAGWIRFKKSLGTAAFFPYWI